MIQEPGYKPGKWVVLGLATLGLMLAVGIPWTVMPVLFTPAATELKLSLGDIGLLWSMLPIGAALVALPGGMLGDRLGFVKTVAIGSFIVAIANALRGVSTSLPTLTVSMFLCGASIALVFPNLQKIPSVIFPARQAGLATGILVSGFAVGGIVTSVLSATVIMPILGSWRNVLFLYSALCVALGILWLMMMRGYESKADSSATGAEASQIRPGFRKSLSAVFGVKEAWLLALGNLGVVGAFIALNGYLPVYLEGIGLARSVADTMTSALFVASIIGAIAVPVMANRFGSARSVLLACAVFAAAAIALLAIASPAFFWVLILLAGATTQGLGTLSITRAVQIKEIGPAYGGTLLGLIGAFANAGGFVLPIIGGRLAEANQTWPFMLWALVSLAAAVCFALLKEARIPATRGLPQAQEKT